MLNKQHWRYLPTNNGDINEENWDIERAKLELEYNMLNLFHQIEATTKITGGHAGLTEIGHGLVVVFLGSPPVTWQSKVLLSRYTPRYL